MKDNTKYLLDSSFKKFLAGAIDKLGYALIRPRPGGSINKSEVKKILLIRLDHIGDVLMTTPAVRALRKTYPEAEIHLLVKSTSFAAVEFNPHIDRIIILDAPWTIPGGEKASWPEVLRVVRFLKKERYDCVVDFRADFREALMTRAAGARYRIGYGARGGGFCYTHRGEYDQLEHDIKKNIKLLKPLGVANSGFDMEMYFSDEDIKTAGNLLSEGGCYDANLVGIHPGGASPYKRWTQEGFTCLGDLLIESGHRVILTGSSDEESLLKSIAVRMRHPPPIIHEMGLKVLAALISRLDYLVCNDTAPSHIAQAVRTRAVVLYGPTHDEITGPLDRTKHTVVRNPVPCSPCWRPGTKFHCSYNFRCWKGLSAEKVVEEIMKKVK